MITVVHVITRLELGGAQENTLTTVRRLDRSRFRVALLHGPGGLLDAEARALLDTDVEVVPELVHELDPLSDLEGLVALTRRLRRRVLASGGRAIVHTHSSKAGVLGRLAARAAGVPRVVHTIHGFGFHPGQSWPTHRAFLLAERAVAPLTHAFIGVSRANLAEATARRLIGPRHVVRLIRSGFDLSAFPSPRRAETRAALGASADTELVLSVANLKPQKDPLTLVEATRTLVQRRPNARVIFAGDGPLRPHVEEAIRAARLERHFTLLGWRRDVPDLMAAADVVVLSSIFEGLPKSAVQALAARRPFVGTRVDGTPEVIRDGQNGFLVEPRDPVALAEALVKALTFRPTDPADLEHLAAWDEGRMVREQAELYEALFPPDPS